MIKFCVINICTVLHLSVSETHIPVSRQCRTAPTAGDRGQSRRAWGWRSRRRIRPGTAGGRHHRRGPCGRRYHWSRRSCATIIIYLDFIWQYVILNKCSANFFNERTVDIGVQRGGGDGPSPPPLLWHFVKDFTKRVYFSQYLPPPSVSLPPF